MNEQTDGRQADHDSPWKMALDAYFQEFLQLLFPAIHTEVDWSQGYSFMDKELQQVTPDANSGRRYADKLIQVFAKDGKETWVLIHVEVQGEPEKAFAELQLPVARPLPGGCGELGGFGRYYREFQAKLFYAGTLGVQP